MISFGVMAITGLVSNLWTRLLPLQWGVWAGFWYAGFAVSMPWLAVSFVRKAQRLTDLG